MNTTASSTCRERAGTWAVPLSVSVKRRPLARSDARTSEAALLFDFVLFSCLFDRLLPFSHPFFCLFWFWCLRSIFSSKYSFVFLSALTCVYK